MNLFSNENFFIIEMKTLIKFIKSPSVFWSKKKIFFNFKRFLAILILNVILLLLITLIFYFLSVIGFRDVFKSSSALLLFKKFSLSTIVTLIVFIMPVIEELLFRFHLIFRNKIISFVIPILFLLLSFIKYDYVFGAIGFILLLLFLIGYKKNETTDFKKLWYKKFKLIFYTTAFFFAFSHLANYDFSLNVLLLSPILILPQFIGGFLIGYLRVQIGFLWGLSLHIVTNAILLLPFIISLSFAFPSVNIHKNEYNLRIKKKGIKSIQNKNYKFNNNSIFIENCSFKKSLSLLLDENEENIKFDESYFSGGISLLKGDILLDIKYKINNPNVKSKKGISESKKTILLELQKSYKFKLTYDNNNVNVEF